MSSEIIKFIRKKDFIYKRELGEGACGKTVLLFDDLMNEYFVCKKYSPIFSEKKIELFENFKNEIKLLHLLHHPNVVRVFNYFIYPENHAGYLLMEYIDGQEIDSHLTQSPERLNELFRQAVDGFAYLESNNILHRDIRPQNLMVDEFGTLKIIDFGFGKQVYNDEDFDKSISLNWWCEPPLEFSDKKYNFSTEIYFIGKLFEKLIKDIDIAHFKHIQILSKMCAMDPASRYQSFTEILNMMLGEQFQEIEFEGSEKEVYRNFTDQLVQALVALDPDAKYVKDQDKIRANLERLYKNVMLEEIVPNNSKVANCFIDGAYTFSKSSTIYVEDLKRFIDLIRRVSKEKQNIIFANTRTKLDAVDRRAPTPDFDDDIPF